MVAIKLRFAAAVAAAVVSSIAFADATPLDDGFTEEEWERVSFAPCSGGSSVRRLKTSGDYVHIFNDPTGTFRAPADRPVTIHYLLVGGGGAGGYTGGGGGGGGGVQVGTLTIPAGGIANIEVGYGGIPTVGGKLATWNGIYLNHPADLFTKLVLNSGLSGATPAGNGLATTLTVGDAEISAPGGGGGGNFTGNGAVVSGAGTGGKGAGNAGTYLAQGGGSSFNPPPDSPVAADSAGGRGADGCSTYILGEISYYAGGGGGAANKTGKAEGQGGLGGGGNGTCFDDCCMGYCGIDNTGGGGGGGTHGGKSNWQFGGYGGSGVVIIRYSVDDDCSLSKIGCIDRTVEGDVTIGSYATATQIETSGAPGVGGDVITHLVTSLSDEYVHQFNQSGAFVSPNEDVWLDFLIVAGGGGGGNGEYYGGGGGAGGVRYGRMLVPASTTISIVVGDGGTAPRGAKGGVGGDSTLTMGDFVIEALGGGGGGYFKSTGGSQIDGTSGGSGGGSAALSTDFEQGTQGGLAIAITTSPIVPLTSSANAGGGGAGRMGGMAYKDANSVSHGGDGGDGVLCAITGENVWYAGGGGSAFQSNSNGLGGNGGGADGAKNGAAATATTPNTGGGGGGGYNGTYPGSDGASGVVILRYASTLKPVESGSQFDISEGIDVEDPLANCRGETFDNRGHGGEWTRLTNGDFLHTFTNLEAAMKFTAPTGGVSSLRYLVVAGGGSGGSSYGGGGGGGGGVCAGYFAGVEGEKLWLDIGAGGASTQGDRGLNGDDSLVTNAAKTVIAIGGGGGGGYKNGSPDALTNGGAGGSGGGGGLAGGNPPGGEGIAGQGNNGGAGNSSNAGGGGGGACAAGTGADGTLKKIGSGGDGYCSTITGVAGVYYSGGGAGGQQERKGYSAGTPGIGSGSGCFGGGGSAATDATQANKASEAGGNGVVYIRYASAVPTEGEGAIPLGASGSDFVDFSTMEMPAIPDQIWKREYGAHHVFTPEIPAALPDGFPLVAGEDFAVEYENNELDRLGIGESVTATVTITGINGHTGSKQLSFKICGRGAVFYLK